MKPTLLLLTLLCTCGLAPLNAQLTLALEGGIGFGKHNHEPLIPDPTTTPVREEKLRAVGGDAVALRLSYAAASQKFTYDLRLQYLSRGYQHVYVERPPGAVLFADALTSEVRFLDFLPGLTYHFGRQLSLSGGPYYAIALSEKNTPDILTSGEKLHQQDYGLHLSGRFSVGRVYLWAQHQLSLQSFDFLAFTNAYPDVRPIQNPSPVSVFVLGLGYQLIR